MEGHRVLLKAVTVFMMALAFGFFCGTTSRAYGIQYDFQPVSEIPEGKAADDYIALSFESVEYEIQKGDTLWGISEAFLGSGERYGEIFETNGGVIADADLIFPGDVITISSYLYIPKDEYDRGVLRYEGAVHIATPDMVDNSMFLVTDIYDTSDYGKSSGGITIFSLPITNHMGENALTDDWESFVAEVERCSETCGGRVSNLIFEKYEIEGACDLCGYSFDFDTGEKIVQFAVFYRLGAYNMAEVVGVWEPAKKQSFLANTAMVDVTRYIAASFEDFGGWIGMGFTKSTENIGAGDWNYPELHNLFTAAMKNFTAYAERPQGDMPGDYEIVWENEIFEQLVREALTGLWQLSEEEKEAFDNRPVMASDLAVITDIECRKYPPYYLSSDEEHIPELYLTLNGYSVSMEIDEETFISCEDLQYFKEARSLFIKVCDLADYSFIGEMNRLRTLAIQAGKAVDNVDFLGNLTELCTLDLRGYYSFDSTDYGYENEDGQIAFYGVTDISCLKNCTHLGYLTLEMPAIEDFSFLASCPEICTIILSPEICMEEGCREEHYDGYEHGEEKELPVLPDLTLLPDARFLEFYGNSYRWEP